MADELFSNLLGAGTVHLGVDMQRIFSSGGPWATPWMDRVLPVVSVRFALSRTHDCHALHNAPAP
jgi:hypothetical protein